ncbi:hypothetical protein Bca52824_035318 [Brassica carinata]|uniref:Uncharacterized protein n=1 Tax=Brassica carinata TaxID=52824 RepID=A0A8X7V2L3_BRACI|nr:hypothetical protein Bca52824_035318 [Brassica carinata]
MGDDAEINRPAIDHHSDNIYDHTRDVLPCGDRTGEKDILYQRLIEERSSFLHDFFFDWHQAASVSEIKIMQFQIQGLHSRRSNHEIQKPKTSLWDSSFRLKRSPVEKPVIFSEEGAAKAEELRQNKKK